MIYQILHCFGVNLGAFVETLHLFSLLGSHCLMEHLIGLFKGFSPLSTLLVVGKRQAIERKALKLSHSCLAAYSLRYVCYYNARVINFCQLVLFMERII